MALGSAANFESPEYLIDWADTQIGEIEAICETFAQSNEITPVSHFDFKKGEYVGKILFENAFPKDLRGRVSSAIKDLRDTLDQATYAASAIIRGKGSRTTHFPFGENRLDLENSLSLRKASKCKGIPEELFPILRSFEPYPAGDGYTGGNTNLRLLGRVSGPHKHHITLTIANEGVLQGLAAGVLGFSDGGSLVIPPIWDAQNSTLEVVRYPPGGTVKMNPILGIAVTFGEGPLANVEVAPFLKDVAATVRTIVVALKTFVEGRSTQT